MLENKAEFDILFFKSMWTLPIGHILISGVSLDVSFQVKKKICKIEDFAGIAQTTN